MVELRMLGPLEAMVGETLVPLGGPKQRAVLARIALHPGTPVSQDALIDALWPNSIPDTAATTLSAYVSRLRKTLGADTISRESAGYVLSSEAVTRDVDRFEALLRDSSTALETKPILLKGASDLWRGPFLGDLGSEPWAQPEATRLGELRTLAVEDRFIAALDAGGGPGLIPEIELELTRAPLRERLWEVLMLSLYRSGRQADALRAYRRAVHLLGAELGIEPSERLRRLEESILFQHPDLLARAERAEAVGVPNNLPDQLLLVLGRGAAAEGLEDRLRSDRLVTLVGIGGVGKTTLALEVARRVGRHFPGGVWWVDLARLAVGTSVDDAFMDALGLEPRPGLGPLDVIATAVGESNALFVVDNCEHLLDSAKAAVSGLMEACTGVSVLATSREILGIRGEQIAPVGPLPVPSSIEDAINNPSVDLFARRAGGAAGKFQLTSVVLPAVVDIVRRLDGLPLAIEIAASQLPIMSLSDLADGLKERFVTLMVEGKAPRHTTMQAALDWTWQRLDSRTHRTLVFLSAFAGPFTEDAASLAMEDDAGPALRSLVNMSLLQEPVRSERDGRSRYRMLEPTKQFVRSRVPADVDPDIAHASAFATLAAREEQCLHGPSQAEAFSRLEEDGAEYLKAVDAMRDRPEGSALIAGIAGALWYWLMQTGDGVGARRLLERAIEAPGLSRGERERLSAASVLVGSELGEPGVAERANAAIAATVGLAPEDEAWVWLFAGDALTSIGEYHASRQPLEGAAEYFAGIGLDWGRGWAHLRLCRSYGLTGDFATADTHLAAAERYLLLAGDLQHIAYARLIRGNRDRLLGGFEASLVAIRDALDRCVALGQELVADECRFLEARVLVNLGRWEEAVSAADRLAAGAARAGRFSSVPGARLIIAQAMVGAGTDLPGARSVCNAILRDSEEGFPGVLFSVYAELVWIHVLEGDLARALEISPRLDALSESENPWAVAVGLLVEARLALASDEKARAVEASDQVIGLLPIELQPHGFIAAHLVAGLAGDDPTGRLEAVDGALDDFGLGLDAITRRDLAALRSLVGELPAG